MTTYLLTDSPLSFNQVFMLTYYQYLGNCPPTPPLTQQQSIDNNLGLILG